MAAVKGNLRTLSVIYALAGTYASMLMVVWQPFVLSLGASMAFLGLLESLSHRHRGLVTTLVQPLGGAASDMVGRKPLMLAGSFTFLAALGLVMLAGATRNPHLLLPAVIVWALSALANPAYDASVAESAGAEELGSAYGRVTVCMLAPGVVMATIGGLVAVRWGYNAVFSAAVLLEATVVALVIFGIRETRSKSGASFSLGKLAASLGRMGRPPRGLTRFYVATAVDAFAWGLGAAILFGLLRKAYGFTELQLGIMQSAFIAAWVVLGIPLGKLVDRYGCKGFLLLSEVAGLFVLAGWLTARAFEHFVLLHALFGVVAATWVPAMLAYAANRTAEEDRAKALGALSAFRGLAGFSAPLVGGYLFEWWGFLAPIQANLAVVLVALALIAVLVEPTPGVRRLPLPLKP